MISVSNCSPAQPVARATIEKFIQTILKHINQKRYISAIQTLNTLRSGMDGVDNDWITDPSAQEEILTVIDDTVDYLSTFL